jgi:hypothetical protein
MSNTFLFPADDADFRFIRRNYFVRRTISSLLISRIGIASDAISEIRIAVGSKRQKKICENLRYLRET